MLKVSNLAVSYGDAMALQGVSFEVRRGSVTVLLGANGAGKSTVLKTISGLVPVREGEITFDGERLDRLAPHRIAALGIAHVPEGRRIFPGMSVAEHLTLGAFVARAARAQKLEEVYALFPRLKERAGQAAGTLSGGEQQMLAIGRGLMMSPRLLMLDEPSLGLAPLLVKEVFEAIGKIRREGVTLLLVEQNTKLALSIGDDAYILQNGKVLMQGPCAELLHNDAVKRAYLGSE
jgi:branched-chain amino acid transport system ATP-binding protein